MFMDQKTLICQFHVDLHIQLNLNQNLRKNFGNTNKLIENLYEDIKLIGYLK